MAQGPVIEWRFYDWEESRISGYADIYIPKDRMCEVYGIHSCAGVISNGSCRVLVDNVLKQTLIGNHRYSRTWNGLRVRTNDATVGKYYALRVYNRALTPSELAHNLAIDKARFNF